MRQISYLILDVDGTLTDGKIYMGNHGELMKAFSIKDGCGIHDILIPSGIEPLIITGRNSDILINRCKEIGIERVYQGVNDKIEVLQKVSKDLSQVAYIGDDINDLPCMHLIKAAGGVIGCPRDAVEKVIKIADYVAEHDGGNGAVRDFIEWLIETE